MRRGLVLGGGGFFGAFQAGAYEGLGSFDCIVGASAGALNGWAIAAGMPAAELQRLWLEAARKTRLRPRFPRFWGDAIVDTAQQQEMIRALVRDWRPRVDFAVVVSQGWNGKQVLVRNEEVTPEAMLASCAVPLFRPAQVVNGRLSYDGGLRDACPLWTAKAMGAEEVVAVNVWTHLPKWWPGAGVRKRRKLEGVTMIEPSAPLGAPWESAVASPEKVAAWIEAGRRAALAYVKGC